MTYSRIGVDGGIQCSRWFDLIAVVDLGVGNLASLASALSFLGANYEITKDAGLIAAAETVILPGVGAFDTAVASLDEIDLRRTLMERSADGVAMLGICLGLQLLCEGSEEGQLPGLGLLRGRATRLGVSPSVKVPHVGFATVRATEGTWLAQALGASPDFYFTHSFAIRDTADGAVEGQCAYDGGFVAAVDRWPVVAVQFHPEKSQSSGLRFLLAFLQRSEART